MASPVEMDEVSLHSNNVTREDRDLKTQPQVTISTFDQYKNLLTSSKINWLLLAVPIGIGVGSGSDSPGATFFFAFLSLIPLAALLGDVTESLSEYLPDSLAGLLSATFGNATELIISIVGLARAREEPYLIRVVQASLLGSVLSNMLLVLGCSFLAGGVKFNVQKFNTTASLTSCSLLMLAVFGLLIPASFSYADQSPAHVLVLSRWTAFLLFAIYGAFLYFQLNTHKHLYADDVEEEQAQSDKKNDDANIEAGDSDTKKLVDNSSEGKEGGDHAEEEEEGPALTKTNCLIGLTVISVLISVMSDYLVSSIEPVSISWGLSRSFISVILIPIVGNACEHWAAITFAMKNKMEISLGVAIGSSTQIALGVLPLMVIFGWMMGVPLSLDFHAFESIAMFLSVIICQGIVADGASNWLEGIMLICAYSILSIAFWFHKA